MRNATEESERRRVRETGRAEEKEGRVPLETHPAVRPRLSYDVSNPDCEGQHSTEASCPPPQIRPAQTESEAARVKAATHARCNGNFAFDSSTRSAEKAFSHAVERRLEELGINECLPRGCQ